MPRKPPGNKKQKGATSCPELQEEKKARAVEMQIGGMTRKATAKAMGVDRETIRRWSKEVMTEEEVLRRRDISRARLAKLLPICDEGALKVVSDHSMENRSHFNKMALAIYRSFGVVLDEPSINLNTISPIIITNGGRREVIGESIEDLESSATPPPSTDER